MKKDVDNLLQYWHNTRIDKNKPTGCSSPSIGFSTVQINRGSLPYLIDLCQQLRGSLLYIVS